MVRAQCDTGRSLLFGCCKIHGFFFDFMDICHPPGMAAAFKGGGQKDFRQAHRRLFIDHPAAHAEDIGVVVAAGHLRAEIIGHHCRTDSRHFIGRYGNPDASAAAKDAPLGLSLCHKTRHLFGNRAIIYGFLAVSPEIPVGNLLLLQIPLHGLLQSVTAVVRAQCDHAFHPPFSY